MYSERIDLVRPLKAANKWAIAILNFKEFQFEKIGSEPRGSLITWIGCLHIHQER